MHTGNSGFFSKIKNVFTPAAAAYNHGHSVSNSHNLNSHMPDEKPTGNETPLTKTVNAFSYVTPTESITAKEISLRTVEVSAKQYELPEEKDLDITFATSFINAGGKFIFCESLKDAIEGMRMLKQDMGWDHIFCWENEIKDAFADNGFQKGALGFTIENSNAAVSLCESLVADAGTIILNPKQASRRRLSCFPKTHIILTDVAHLKANENEGLELFNQMHKGELPSIIKLGSCNSGHFYDKQRLILNAEGPEDVYVFLVDEIIPPSLRP